jgi:hypothetical protein
MQTRLFASLAGGLLGLALASPINSALGLPGPLALIACAGAGIAIGCIASTLFDVFTASSGSDQAKSGN